jgi:outer membrane protein TolC
MGQHKALKKARFQPPSPLIARWCAPADFFELRRSLSAMPALPFRRLWATGSPALLAALLALPAAQVQARCVDEEQPLPGVAADAGPAVDPRQTLRTLVQDALQRSHAVGASKLLAEAAVSDLEESRAAKALQASMGMGLGPGGTRENEVRQTQSLQSRVSLNVSQLLYDGGRTDRLTDWRTQLAESARLGVQSVQEQLAVTTVSLALERNRYRQHMQVYGQQVRKMGCLVEALETIVKADRGRASELVQARKSLQQAELSLVQAQSQSRQVDVRLRRLVGDGLPGTEGLASLLLQVPDLPQIVADVEQSADVAAATAQAAAADSYAQAVAAGGKPQVSWALAAAARAGAGGSMGSTRGSDYSLAVSLNVPLLSPGLAPASTAARKRAEAAAAQRAETVETRRFRAAEVHEQTVSSFDRARRTSALLKNTDQLRDFTLQQWQQLGKRSLFDVMATESEHYNLRVSYINALIDGQQLNANLLSLGRGVSQWLQ